MMKSDLRRAVKPTTIIESEPLSALLGCSAVIATETFQHTGSFKFRAAYLAAIDTPSGHLIAASSGNFGQALAYACKLLGKKCTIVMPITSAAVKIEAVRRHLATVELVDLSKISRADKVSQIASQNPDCAVLSAYDHELVIEGNASLGDELALLEKLDCVVAPIGGGGLTAGLIRGLRRSGSSSLVYGAEPAIANDASRSFREGKIIANLAEPQSIADGARTLSVGKCNWPILQTGLADVLEVSESAIEDAVRLLFSVVNLKSEPTGALAVAAVKANKSLFQGKRVCCVVSGGNVDPQLYSKIVSSA